jgi:hypothetical protein
MQRLFTILLALDDAKLNQIVYRNLGFYTFAIGPHLARIHHQVNVL